MSTNVVGKIGEGGMGVVYKALHPTLERPVVINRLASRLAKNQYMLQRFLRVRLRDLYSKVAELRPVMESTAKLGR